MYIHSLMLNHYFQMGVLCDTGKQFWGLKIPFDDINAWMPDTSKQLQYPTSSLQETQVSNWYM